MVQWFENVVETDERIFQKKNLSLAIQRGNAASIMDYADCRVYAYMQIVLHWGPYA